MALITRKGQMVPEPPHACTLQTNQGWGKNERRPAAMAWTFEGLYDGYTAGQSRKTRPPRSPQFNVVDKPGFGRNHEHTQKKRRLLR